MLTIAWPKLSPLSGIDRAVPFDAKQLLPKVVAYYLPSPYAAVRWTVDDARVIPPNRFTVPIYVASLVLEVGDGTGYAHAAVALMRAYLNHGVVCLDIEEDAISSTPGAVAALDIQEQVAREFMQTVFETSGYIPIVYGSAALYTRLKNNVWLAYWLPDSSAPATSFNIAPGVEPRLDNGQYVPTPIGWQYGGNVLSADLGVTDSSLWSPFLFTTAKKNYTANGREDMRLYTTQPDDTLASINKKFYGEQDFTQQLYAVNVRTLRQYGTGAIAPGLELVVPWPEGEKQDVAADNTAPVPVVADDTTTVTPHAAEVPITPTPTTAPSVTPSATDSAVQALAKAIVAFDTQQDSDGPLNPDTVASFLHLFKTWWQS